MNTDVFKVSPWVINGVRCDLRYCRNKYPYMLQTESQNVGTAENESLKYIWREKTKEWEHVVDTYSTTAYSK
jgi:hypothetical protein